MVHFEAFTPVKNIYMKGREFMLRHHKEMEFTRARNQVFSVLSYTMNYKSGAIYMMGQTNYDTMQYRNYVHWSMTVFTTFKK